MKFLTACVLLMSFVRSAEAANGWCAFPPDHPVAPSESNHHSEAYDSGKKMKEAHTSLNQCLAESKFNIAIATFNGVQCKRPKLDKGDNIYVNGIPNPLFSVENIGAVAIYSALPHGEFAFSATRDCKKGGVSSLTVNHPFNTDKGSALGACRDFNNSSAISEGRTGQVTGFEFMHFGEDAKKCLATAKKLSHANQNDPGSSIKSSQKKNRAPSVQPTSEERGYEVRKVHEAQ